MPTLIKDGAVAENPWQLVDKEADLATALALPGEYLIVPFALWQEHKTELSESDKIVGVWMDSDDDPYALSEDVTRLPLIAVNFPSFRDGRAFSTAAILRQRLHFRGEVRAIGDILRDLLFYMKKCGIDSFDLSDQVKVDDALTAFNDFATTYTGTIEEPVPLFRRRAS